MKKKQDDIFEPAMPVVPQGWDVLPFEQAIDVISDKSKRVKQSAYLPSGRLPVIDQGQVFIGGYTDDEDMAFEGELPVILFGDHTRTIKYVDRPFAVGAEGVKILKPTGEFEPKYLYHLLRSLQIPSRGYSRHFQFLRKFHFLRAPKGQQKRIVAEIEKQFSRLDEAVANLKRVKANLKRYRAAVLKAAVEGRLVETEAELARREGRSFETGEQLLQRILETRRSQWKGKGKYKDPAAPDTTNLPELAEGWVWVNFDQVTERVTKGSSPNWQGFEYCDKGIPFVRSQNVGWGVTDLSDIAYLPPKFNEVEKKSVLREGDVLLNIVGASIGRAAIAPGTVAGGNVNQAVAVIRLYVAGVNNEFVLLYLLSGQAQRRIHAQKVDVARANFSLEDIREMPLALPPRVEQDRVVAEVDRRLSLIRETEAQVDANLQRAERLRQSILSSAFGMTQQPN